MQPLPKHQHGKGEKDFQALIQDMINVPLPMNKPQWMFYYQEEYLEDYSVILWKQHHSMADGVSSMSLVLAFGDKYDITTLIPIRKVSFIERLFLRVSFPFYIPKIFFNSLSLKALKNPLHDGVRKLTGRKLISTSNNFSFNDIKNAAKISKVTINDLVTASLGSAVKQYFELKGDSKSDKLNIVIPANIRFRHYETLDQLKMENKFAPISMTIPLKKTMEESMKVVPKVTASLRNAFGEVYATYAASFYSTMFLPHNLLDWFIAQSSFPFTMAFSNTPGPIKPICDGDKRSRQMISYIIPSGFTGIGVACLTYVETFRITMTVDDSIMKDP